MSQRLIKKSKHMSPIEAAALQGTFQRYCMNHFSAASVAVGEFYWWTASGNRCSKYTFDCLLTTWLGAAHLLCVTSLQWKKMWHTLLISKTLLCLGLPLLYHNSINWSSFKTTHPSLNLTHAVLLYIISVTEEVNCLGLLSNTW